MRPVLLSDTVQTDSFTAHNNNKSDDLLIAIWIVDWRMGHEGIKMKELKMFIPSFSPPPPPPASSIESEVPLSGILSTLSKPYNLPEIHKFFPRLGS